MYNYEASNIENAYSIRRPSANENCEKASKYFSPTPPIWIENDPGNTSDCTSFPHYIVSPTPEKEKSNLSDIQHNEGIEGNKFDKCDQLNDIKNILAFSSEKDSLITLGKDLPDITVNYMINSLNLTSYWLLF